MARDRNDHYIPDNLYLSGKPREAEINKRWDKTVIALGDADELNRVSKWWWARCDQEPAPVAINDNGTVTSSDEHWSLFKGHRVQVDLEFHTWNERTVNDWKGRDEIDGYYEWVIHLNRIRVWSGQGRGEVLRGISKMQETLEKLLSDTFVIHEWTEEEIASLEGRKIYYWNTPAVIERQIIAHEGRIVIKPAEGCEFPLAPYEQEGDMTKDDHSEVVTTLFDPHIWWWREK